MIASVLRYNIAALINAIIYVGIMSAVGALLVFLLPDSFSENIDTILVLKLLFVWNLLVTIVKYHGKHPNQILNGKNED